MSGEDLKKKLKESGLSMAEIARRLGVLPQSLNQFFLAEDVRTGLLEDLCLALNKDMGFFYDVTPQPQPEEESRINLLTKELLQLRLENDSLYERLRLKDDPDQPHKESEVYQLWMEYMKLENKRADFYSRMQELFNNQKNG